MGERTDEMTNYGYDDRDRDLRGDHRSSNELRRDIERTQHEITRTLREIEDRLSPRNMMDRAGDAIRSAPRRTSRKLVDRIRENPIPAALAGVGLFMLFRGSDRETDVEYDYGSGAGYNYNRGRYDTLESSRGYRPDRGQYWEEADDRGGIREKMSDVGERVSDAAATVKDKTSDLVDDARERTSEFVDEASERLHDVGSRARYQARRARYEFQDTMNDNPLVMGLAGVALGAILGLSVPETRKENEMLGPVRDRLANRAADVAQDKIERAKHVAEAATDAATDAAKREADRQGLTSDLEGNTLPPNQPGTTPGLNRDTSHPGYQTSGSPRTPGSNVGGSGVTSPSTTPGTPRNVGTPGRTGGSDLGSSGTGFTGAPSSNRPSGQVPSNPKTPGSDFGKRGR